MPYNRKFINVLSASLNKTFFSFQPVNNSAKVYQSIKILFIYIFIGANTDATATNNSNTDAHNHNIHKTKNQMIRKSKHLNDIYFG